MKRLITSYTYHEGTFIPDDKASLDGYKKTLISGERLRVTIEPYPEKRSEQAFNLFHKLRDRYAAECGVGREEAKIAFKLAHGVVLPIEHNFNCEREGQVVELPNGHFVFLVSTREYTVKEMHDLVKGTINECMDAQVDIEDLIMEWRG